MYLHEIGLSYYKALLYSPTLGRFLQTDPIGYGDGMNWYAYTHNDPVNGTDPTGLIVGPLPPPPSSLRDIIVQGNRLPSSWTNTPGAGNGTKVDCGSMGCDTLGLTDTSGIHNDNASDSSSGQAIQNEQQMLQKKALQLAQNTPSSHERYGLWHWWEKMVGAGAGTDAQAAKDAVNECASKINGSEVAQNAAQEAAISGAEDFAREATGGPEAAGAGAIKGAAEGAVEGAAESVAEQCSSQ